MICTCGSVYGQTVNVRDGGKAEWKCRDCAKVQPWVDEPAGRLTGLRPATLERPAWIEAAAKLFCENHLPSPWKAPNEQGILADIIFSEWRKSL